MLILAVNPLSVCQFEIIKKVNIIINKSLKINHDQNTVFWYCSHRLYKCLAKMSNNKKKYINEHQEVGKELRFLKIPEVLTLIFFQW